MRPISKDITKHYQIACSSGELHAICILQAHVCYVLIIPFFFSVFLLHMWYRTKWQIRLNICILKHTYKILLNLKVENMPNLGIEIKRKCPICSKVFIIKMLESVYCSPKCSKIANKRKKDKEKKQVQTVAEQIVLARIRIIIMSRYFQIGDACFCQTICPKLTNFWIVSDKWYFAFLVANSFKVQKMHFELHLGNSYQKQRQ